LGLEYSYLADVFTPPWLEYSYLLPESDIL